MTSRRDYYRDPDAPEANSLVPGGSALVIDDRGAVLMQRRSDSGNWSFPGGTMEIGETLEQCVIRETKEETGLDVDPEHVVAYADGEVRQEFNITFYARVTGGDITVSAESTEVAFLTPAHLQTLPMHETVRLRLRHHTEQRTNPYLG
ncbi:NUDIX hydrolase [Nocardia carnea]|uniref:NUDIX hydrolase n=1 Tax=Nocardia carnea TaxID=37328 RepID=UPI002458FAE4|nr:NUDIX domain-containing protein [Nocardia carnea]